MYTTIPTPNPNRHRNHNHNPNPIKPNSPRWGYSSSSHSLQFSSASAFDSKVFTAYKSKTTAIKCGVDHRQMWWPIFLYHHAVLTSWLVGLRLVLRRYIAISNVFAEWFSAKKTVATKIVPYDSQCLSKGIRLFKASPQVLPRTPHHSGFSVPRRGIEKLHTRYMFMHVLPQTPSPSLAGMSLPHNTRRQYLRSSSATQTVGAALQ